MSDTTVELYYDPFDHKIDDNPYPVWRRMRAEAPLYYNDKHNFYALSRYDDVAPALHDWQTYRSGHGTTADILFAGVEIPPGILLFEDPPLHDLHRRLLSRVFTPRRMLAVEDLVRDLCCRALDPLRGSDGFDFVADLGAVMPMRTIGYLLGIPEEGQQAIRDRNDKNITIDSEGAAFDPKKFEDSVALFADYIEWRATHPSDDLMTELLNAQVEEPDGTVRPLERTEVLAYTAMIAGAGNETTARLIGFMGELLGEPPGPETRTRCRSFADPLRGRRDAALRTTVTGAGAVRRPGRRALRADRDRGVLHAVAQRVGQSRRDSLRATRPLSTFTVRVDI